MAEDPDNPPTRGYSGLYFIIVGLLVAVLAVLAYFFLSGGDAPPPMEPAPGAPAPSPESPSK